MIPNFIQKPFGAAAVLAAAIGGPYAAFETETGTSLRKSLFNSGRSPEAADPYNASSSTGFPSSGFPPNGYPSNDSYALNALNDSYATGGSMRNMPAGSPVPSAGYQNSGQPISVTYGQPIIQPLGPSFPSGVSAVPTGMSGPPSMSQSMSATPPPGVLESRQGPSNLVPGGTNQLWDYTLGVPSLQQVQQQPTPLGGGEVHDLREVLRFDITPNWLPQRFSRVSTVLSNVQMDGLRVPLITGTRPTDVAGTLTYYFDAGQSLRRINLHGLTGDPSQLATLMVQFYGLQPEQSLGGQLFTTRWNNRITNLLQIAPAPVIYAGADHSKYIVFLELNQASASFGLSQEASDLLQNAQSTRRW